MPRDPNQRTPLAVKIALALILAAILVPLAIVVGIFVVCQFAGITVPG